MTTFVFYAHHQCVKTVPIDPACAKCSDTHLVGELVGGAVEAHHKRAGHIEVVVVIVVRGERVVRDVPTEVRREREGDAERVLHLIGGSDVPNNNNVGKVTRVARRERASRGKASTTVSQEGCADSVQ